MFVADFLAAVLAYGLYVLWNTIPIRVRCPRCKDIILSNTPWVCGFCGEKNTGANVNSFLGECKKCHDEPKAYRCHHDKCKQLIFFSSDNDPLGYAYRLDSKNEQPDNKTKQGMDHKDAITERERQIALAELDAKLKAIKEKAEGPKIKSAAERKADEVDAIVDGIMGARLHCKKREEEARKQLSGQDLDDALEAIEEAKKRVA